MRILPLLLLVAPLAAQAAEGANAESVNYLTQVKPLLAARCYACHGALKQEAGLRLDTAESIRKGSEAGAVLVVGKSGESSLIERVAEKDPELRMPPENEGSPLTASEIAVLRAWIDQGATGPKDEKPEADPREHWAFRAPVRAPEPKVKNSSWVKNPIDAFIAAEHDRHGLRPQAPADRRLLLRRVYLDLIGLPPTVAQQEAFLADTSSDAYERVVDSLLASPQYGERWGRHWMDLWRYSDWWGLGADVRNSQKHIWHWRDWIVESLNDDVGYDEMLRQMLAADELYPEDPAKLRATGYLVRNYFKFNRNTWMEGTIEHTSKAFLGLTLNCSRCHDHKYDPLSQVEYYRFRAFFEPYQVRTDQVPGEADYEKDGIPRVFDCHLDAPTYRFVRGDEKQPVKDQPLTPAVPGVLSFDDLEISPVSLPPAAHQPGLRPWILQNHLTAADRQVAAAQAALEKAQNMLATAKEAAKAKEEEKKKAELPSANKTNTANSTDNVDALLESAAVDGKVNGKKAATNSSLKPAVKDDFLMAKPELWETISGQWKYDGQRAVQAQDTMMRGVLRLKAPQPSDFQAKLNFSILGGQTYKSVGLAFDVSEGNELLVYLSAHAPEPKLQIAYKKGNAHVYPPDGKLPVTVKHNDPQELIIRVRGTTINVEWNGQHALAWTSPVPRKPGSIDLVTFDAVAAFTVFELASLPPTVQLATSKKPNSPGPSSKMPSVEVAQAELKIAEKALAAAQLQAPSFKARAAADRARHEKSPNVDVTALIREAARAEKLAAAAKAEEDLARAQLAVLQAEAAKKADAEKKLTAAREANEKAQKAVESAGETYTSLSGALKAFESSVETAEQRLRPFPEKSTGRRSALARWLTDPRHPLTARVAVNHIWVRHMGKPLVPNVFDFGRKGLPPTHPALLDWLATELIENNWSQKHLHQLILKSNTYRLSSSAAGAADSQTRDPENRYYWRMNPVRMEAQVVRDTLLSLSRELDLTRGGPSIDPVLNEMTRRRSLYFIHSHNDHHRFLSMFDDANVLECYRREQSIVPQQALALFNSKQAADAASKIAAGLHNQKENAEDASFVRAAFLTVLSTTPNDEESRACVEALAAWAKLSGPASKAASVLQARTNLILALLNHNDFVTVR